MSDAECKVAVTLDDRNAAKYIGVSVSWLRQKRCYGAMGNAMKPPQFIKIGRCVRYLKSDLDTWLQALPRYDHTTAVKAEEDKKREVV